VASYPYTDEAGTLLFEVCRMDPKDFRQRKPDATAQDGWTWKTAGVRKVLFRLPELIEAVGCGETIHIVEGEKDVLALVAAGFAATCNPGGALKWRDDYNEALRGADVVVIADKDTPGREHAALVARSLHGIAKRIRVVELPDTNGKPVKDAADFFAAGGTAEQLRRLVDAAPDWQPEAASTVAPHVEAGKPQDLAALAGELRALIIAALTNKELRDWQRKDLVSKCVVEGLQSVGQFYFHAEQRDFEACMFFCREIGGLNVSVPTPSRLGYPIC